MCSFLTATSQIIFTIKNFHIASLKTQNPYSNTSLSILCSNKEFFCLKVLVAECIKTFYPQTVEVHNFVTTSSFRRKVENWHLMNRFAEVAP